MKVAVLALEWPRAGHHVGGVGRYVKRLVEALRHEVDMTVFALEGAEPLEGVDLVPLPFRDRFARYYWVPLRAASLVRRGDFDIVHAHGDDWPLALPGGPPVVRTLYGLSAWEARTSSGARKVNHWAMAALEELSVRRAAAAVAIGLDSASHFDLRVIPPVIPNGPLFDVAEHLVSKQKRAVFIGTHEGRKQGWLALQAADGLRSDGWDFTVFGPAGDSVKYPDWVDFRSGEPDEVVWSILLRSRLLLVPSVYEGFGIPMWEGLATGCHVIGLHTPGADYLLPSESTAGVLTDDEEGFLRAVRSYAAGGRDLRTDAVSAAERGAEVLRAAAPRHYVDLYRHLAR